MAFRLSTFAGTTLPAYNWTMDFSTPVTRNPVVPTLNGAIDFYGTRRRIEHAQEFEFDATPDPATAAATIRALKTLVGRTGYLVRVDRDGSNEVQRYCRLLAVGFQPKATQRGIENRLMMRFWSNQPFWRSSSLTTHGPTTLTTTTTNMSITVAGEEDILDAVLEIAASSTISALEISHTKTENGETITSKLEYDASLASGHTLTIDGGQYTVDDNSADAYADFSLHADHDEVYWLRLPPGSQTITIVRTGGGGTATLSYYPQYQ